MYKINDIIQTLSNINTNEITQDKMDNINSDLNNIFMEPAKNTGMYKTLETTVKTGNQKQINHGLTNPVKNPKMTT